MRLIAIHIYKWREENPILLSSAYDLSMLWFYQRGIAKEHILFNSRTVAGRIPPGEKAKVALEQNIGDCYCWTSTDYLSDNEYNERVAFFVINQILSDFRSFFKDSSIYQSPEQDTEVGYPNTEEFLKKWQNPAENDKLMKIHEELMQVKDIMRKNLEEIMKRGDNIDVLMQKSSDLSVTSVQFYQKAKKQNEKCCNLS